ncbi:lytic transglycosylase domain-containing protein [Paenibacillus campi]|uniref:lytic transglycosylase domain-containing protein n=1 Tax=Paenibacillus campi TaxID=3106031 RepID=UPI002AFF2A6F|nr:lytic transglycosylase domain-containing protein [Paenibacillus sp. SGZ-1014]
MQIDAKTAKQLLELRYLNASGGGSTGGMDVNTNDTDELFQMMLQQNMGTSSDTSSSGSSVTAMAKLLADGNATSVTGNTYGGANTLGAGTQTMGASDPWTNFDQLPEVDPSNSTTTARLLMNGAGMSMGAGTGSIGSADRASSLSGLPGADDHGSKATAYNEFISSASSKYGIPESLIKAVIDVESSFNPNAGSSAGAKGLMQLMDGTAAGLGVSNSLDPEQNIDGGTKYLSYQLKRYDNNIKTALAAYNAGPGRLQRLGISNDQELMEKFNQLPKETQRYIGKIEAAQQKYTL